MVPYTLNRPDGGGPLAALERRILQASAEIE
ncbi:MAG: hypothetical protein RI937_550, partial [Pseudomonadota bacterium]